jgi:hypothetical protein
MGLPTQRCGNASSSISRHGFTAFDGLPAHDITGSIMVRAVWL